ncbi:MAG TPA: tetratricopeptide repeat protein [Propionibacteriaceae bacterium]|nr:tetratricopeptide repeat protein [Propionibacteriaceae bacterium]
MSASSFNRPGAIDLSALAQRAKQPPAGAAPRPGGASYVLEVTERTFDAEVMRRSLKHPVVVEFYSPRVSTGQQLSAALADLAAAAAGKYLVARLNVDVSPQIVQALQLQAVPMVVGVIGGQIAPLFQGVLAKEQVSAYLDELVKAAVANGIVGRAEPVAAGADVGGPGDGGSTDGAGEPVADPRFAAADEAFARGDFAAARDEFDRLLETNPNDAEAKAGRAQAALLARVSELDSQQTLARAADNPDLQAQLDAADVELFSGLADAAFDRLLTLVRTRTDADKDQARLRLLELFETLGNTDERVLKGRRALMAALF